MAKRSEIIESIPKGDCSSFAVSLRERKVLDCAFFLVLWGARGRSGACRPVVDAENLPFVIELLKAASMGQQPSYLEVAYGDRKLELGSVLVHAELILGGYPCTSDSRFSKMAPGFIALTLQRFLDTDETWLASSHKEAFSRFMAMLQLGPGDAIAEVE